MKIWGYCKQTGKTELIDTCAKNDAGMMLREYRVAFGKDWILWVGLKRDNPLFKPMLRGIDETSHYRSC